MKFPVAYYLFLLYCVAICKPVLPVVQDFIAHTLFEHQHIVTVHQRNGESHLDIELSNAAEENGAGNTAKPVSFDTVTVHCPVETQVVPFVQQPLLIHSYYDRLHHLPFAFAAIQLPPPKA